MIVWSAHHDHACPFQGRQFKVEPIEIVLQSHFLLWSEGPPFSAFAELRLFLRNHVLKPLLLVLGPPRAAWICSTPLFLLPQLLLVLPPTASAAPAVTSSTPMFAHVVENKAVSQTGSVAGAAGNNGHIACVCVCCVWRVACVASSKRQRRLRISGENVASEPFNFAGWSLRNTKVCHPKGASVVPDSVQIYSGLAFSRRLFGEKVQIDNTLCVACCVLCVICCVLCVVCVCVCFMSVLCCVCGCCVRCVRCVRCVYSVC